MRRTAPRVLQALSVTLLLLGITLQPSFAQSSDSQPPSQPEWLALTVVSVKPEMMGEFQNFMKNQTNPALRKAGVKWRDVWQSTPAAGNAFEFVIVMQMEKFAEFDSPNPLEKALGQSGFAAWMAKAGSFVNSVNRSIVRTRPDLSNQGKLTWPPKLAIVTSTVVAPERLQEFENYVKNDLVPVMKQGQATFLVSQVVFGGQGNEYITLLLRENFAEIDKGPVPVQVLGMEGATKLYQKLPAGVITHVERSFSRYVPELSITPEGN